MSLGLGTAALGRPQYINIRETPLNLSLEDFKQQGTAVLEHAYKLGVRYFDTAPGYGMAEELLLNWLKTKNDTSIKITTKFGYTYVANFNANAKIHEIKEHSLNKLNEQWETSKAFLPYLKIYQIHSATLETGVLDNDAILNRLAYLKQKHNIKIGITSTGANQTEIIKKALTIIINGEPLFDIFQVTYNILDQSLNTVLQELITLDKKIIIKEALANGRLFRNSNYKHYSKLYTALEIIAEKHDVNVDAVALKFCEQTIPNSIILSGASNLKQLNSNLKMKAIKLSEAELSLLKDFNTNPIDYWQERKALSWN